MVGFYRQKGVREGEVLAEEKKGLKKKKNNCSRPGELFWGEGESGRGLTPLDSIRKCQIGCFKDDIWKGLKLSLSLALLQGWGWGTNGSIWGL